MKKLPFVLLWVIMSSATTRAQTDCFEELIDPFGGKNPACILPTLGLSQGGAAIPIVRRVNGRFLLYVTHTAPASRSVLTLVAPDKMEVIAGGEAITLQQVRWQPGGGTSKINMSVYVFDLPAEAWRKLAALTKARVKFSAIENDWPADWSAGLKTAKEFFDKLK